MEGTRTREWWRERRSELFTLTGDAFAAKYGVSVSTVCNWRAKLGIRIGADRIAGGNGTRRKDLLVHLADWQSPADLARKLGVTRQTAHGYIERLLAQNALDVAIRGNRGHLYRLKQSS